MSDPSRKLREFPDVASKLAAPTKKSQFERQKAEAEAKRQREQAETAAVYENFVKDFADDDDDEGAAEGGGRSGHSSSRGQDRGGPGGNSGGGGVGGGPSRHFSIAGPQRKSGPGTLPGSFGPPPSRKRPFEASFSHGREKEHGLFKYEDSSAPLNVAAAFQEPDEEEERVQVGNRAVEKPAVKPALQLTSLPPQTSEAFVRSLLPSDLKVDRIRIESAPVPPGSTDRRSTAALVTLALDTPAKDIEDAVNRLKDRYLGYGFNLTISRSFSTASIPESLSISHPFGARVASNVQQASLNRAPPPDSLRHDFAPPESYDTPASHFARGRAPLQVPVKLPDDIKELRLIHKTIEALHKHGPEFEALLMTRPEVKKDPKWAWLWNARSAGGIYYRWRLWEIACEGGHAKQDMRADDEIHVFDNRIPWIAPGKQLPFEFTTRFESFVDESDYNTSDEGESGDEARARRNNRGRPAGETGKVEGRSFLSPLHRAQLTHLLARVPTSTGKLRNGDVARITNFTIRHAATGSEDIVNVLTSNIERPFNISISSESQLTDLADGEGGDEDAEKKQDKEDPSTSKLIGLYLITDVLSSSSTSGVSQAWRYRQLFENALRQRKVFEGLGRLEKELQMGRMSADRWKGRIKGLFDIWEKSSLWSSDAQKHFVKVFFEPTQGTEEEKPVATADEKKISGANVVKMKWKTVDASATGALSRPAWLGLARKEPEKPSASRLDSDNKRRASGEAMEDVTSQTALMGSNGDPMEDVRQENAPAKAIAASATISSAANEKDAAAPAKRQRPRAVDMFGDSDED